MGAAVGATTFSSSDSGDPSNTKKYIYEHTLMAEKQEPESVPTSDIAYFKQMPEPQAA